MKSSHQILTEKIYTALGEASMAWKPIPKGVFDTRKAREIGDKLMEEIETLLAKKLEIISEEGKE